MTQTYIEFIFPGVLVSETSETKVKDRSKPKMPKMAFGYRFFERTVVNKDGEILEGKSKNYSGWTYIGQAFTAEEYIKRPDCNEIARSNIVNNGYTNLVRTEYGQVFPLYEGDSVISK